MQLIDSAMVGRLGATELGAIGFSGIWIWTLFVPFTGTCQGIQAFVSRHDGANEQQLCGPWIWQAIWPLVPGMTLWMFVVALVYPALIAAIGPSPELSSAALEYGYARLPGGPAVVANFVLMGFFRGIGDTRTPLFAVLGGIVVNIALAYALIFGEPGCRSSVSRAQGSRSCGSWTILRCSPSRRSALGARATDLAVSPGARGDGRCRSAPIGGQWLLDMATSRSSAR
jgi:Na+-driven multidrug efflux pump